MEESLQEINRDSKFSHYSNTNSQNASKYNSAYYSDESKKSNKYISKIPNKRKLPNSSFGASPSDKVRQKWKYPNNLLDNSVEGPTILVNDADHLHVIQEVKPRKSKIQATHLRKKERGPLLGNYKKRAYEIEKQKKTIQQIENKYKEYSSYINPLKLSEKRHPGRNKGFS